VKKGCGKAIKGKVIGTAKQFNKNNPGQSPGMKQQLINDVWRIFLLLPAGHAKNVTNTPWIKVKTHDRIKKHKQDIPGKREGGSCPR
jgi:hypothetical protein